MHYYMPHNISKATIYLHTCPWAFEYIYILRGRISCFAHLAKLYMVTSHDWIVNPWVTVWLVGTVIAPVPYLKDHG